MADTLFREVSNLLYWRQSVCLLQGVFSAEISSCRRPQSDIFASPVKANLQHKSVCSCDRREVVVGQPSIPVTRRGTRALQRWRGSHSLS